MLPEPLDKPDAISGDFIPLGNRVGVVLLNVPGRVGNMIDLADGCLRLLLAAENLIGRATVLDEIAGAEMADDPESQDFYVVADVCLHIHGGNADMIQRSSF